MGQLVELLDPRLQLLDLTAQPADLGDQPVLVRGHARNIGDLVRHCPSSPPRLAGHS
jgi:hypothetical protein